MNCSQVRRPAILRAKAHVAEQRLGKMMGVFLSFLDHLF